MPIQEQGHAPHKEDDAQTERSRSPSVLRAELEIPQAVIREYSANQDKDDRREKWRLVVEVLAFFTVMAGVGITYKTLRTTEEAVTLTREQVHIGQRAYLSVDSITDTVVTVARPLFIPVVIKNTGQTPAISIKIQSGILIRDHEPFTLDDAGFKNADIGGIDDMGAGQTRTISVPFKDGEPLDQGTNNLFALYSTETPQSLTVKAKIYLAMVLSYTDVFGGSHRTVQCAFMRAGKFRVCGFLNELR